MADDPRVEIIDTRPVKLDLGSGTRPRDGFRGVDLYAEGAQNVDLFKTPWPWADDSVDELHSSHFLEHVPMVCRSGSVLPVDKDDRDLLCAMMDEAFRVLKPKGRFEIVVPYLQHHRAFQDPTHRRFFCEESFLYFNATWRESNGLGHYLGACNFVFDEATPIRIVDSVHSLRTSEALAAMMAERWNVVTDLRVVLRKP